MNENLSKLRVLLRALPTYLAVATVILTTLASEVVPLLPDNIAVQVAGYIAVGLAWVAAIVRVVSRLTPADPSAYGLLPPSE